MVDGLFNFGGARGDTPEAAIQLARQFREMAGFTTGEVDEIAEMSQRSRDAGAVDSQVNAMAEVRSATA